MYRTHNVVVKLIVAKRGKSMIDCTLVLPLIFGMPNLCAQRSYVVLPWQSMSALNAGVDLNLELF